MPSEGAVSRAVSRDRPGDSPREDSGGSIRSLDAVSAENVKDLSVLLRFLLFVWETYRIAR